MKKKNNIYFKYSHNNYLKLLNNEMLKEDKIIKQINKNFINK